MCGIAVVLLMMLVVVFFILYAYLLAPHHMATGFCLHHHHIRTVTTRKWRNNFFDLNSSPSSLSSSAQGGTNTQWQYDDTFYTAKNNQDISIHGRRYNAIITKTGSSNHHKRWIGTFHSPTFTSNSNGKQNGIITTNSSTSPPPPIEAINAIQATHRWANNFVHKLNLCPWAGSSLNTPGAICYWVLLVDEDEAMDKMEEIVREAGIHLILATTTTTTTDDDDRIDPSVAISFIILVPNMRTATTASNNNNNNNNDNGIPNFGNFHEFFIDLEDRFLDECDDYWDAFDDDNIDDKTTGDDNDSHNRPPLGCEITIAAFHPEWQFNCNEDDDDDDHNEEEDEVVVVHPNDYEKRTPYPTISIVMSSAIDGLMKERQDSSNSSSSSAPATIRIAELNEKTLSAIGVKRLKEIFDKDVLACPRDNVN